MPINPDDIDYCEFGVALLVSGDTHFQVPVTLSVKRLLGEMLKTTLNNLGDSLHWEQFDCAERYPSTACLKYPTNDAVVINLKNLYTVQNIPSAADALQDPSKIDYYFARFRDKQGNECTAVHKASTFKSAVGKRFMHIINGQLTAVENDLFRLDSDFDFIIFPDQIAIYRPIQFERIADFDNELINIAPAHIQTLTAAITDLDFTFATAFVPKSARIRRLLAAITTRSDLSSISADKFSNACKENGISLVQHNGKWTPEPKHEMAFLEMLDRRRYNDPLIDQNPDAYRADARKKV